ncbi:Ig-like domain-containing protein [Glaciihabitans sp. dw_435]|uniref:Ig-like domain-containing protein n=1 Tax=Glaciihabitans sp. dw_435 TaxID=2720081 RepID=UPI001BD229D9|nr:Ig-like domain-containing protein [Glaciihabitans sp. dw_435]
MSIFSSWGRGRRAIASAVVIAIAAGIPVTVAVLHEGFPTSDVELNTRDVWVTNNTLSLAGRLNRQIEELTAGVTTVSQSIDVVQDGKNVFLHDLSQNTLERIDQSRVTLVQKALVPAGAEIALGATTLTVLDPADGKLWVVDVANELNFDPTTAKPALTLGVGAHATVGLDGVVYATSPKKSKLYEIEGAGFKSTSVSLKIPAVHQLAVVGSKPVILDAEKDVLITEDGTNIALGSDGIRLQQSSAKNDFALVAGADSLLEVPLDGGDVTKISADIAPVTAATDVSAPVWLDGCAHAAWAGGQRYLEACTGAKARTIDITEPTRGYALEFRVNGHVVALNNLVNGNTWVLQSSLRLINNWQEITPPQENTPEKGTEKSSQQSFEETLATRTDVNRPPIARNDDFGVRPGRTTILPVLDNDTDPDGDVLVITDFTAIPENIGHIDAIDGGRALQFTPGQSVSGGTSFRYTVSDGRSGGVTEASVNLRIVPLEQNNAPVSNRDGATSVEAGHSIAYNVLSDWIDPDGDDLLLKAASATSADDVRYTPDGFITFQDKAGVLGKKTVSFIVSDGTLNATGEFTVDVKADGSMTPVATPDFISVFAGQTVVVEPLANDLSPSGAPLRLLAVDDAPPTATVTPNLDAGTVAVSSTLVGPMYLKYAVAAGTPTGNGLIRVDVLPDPTEDLPPIAVKDVGYLRSDEATTVKVLDNDVSPTGKVLSVQSVDTENTSDAVTVELLNNTVIRVTASSALTEQTQFTYTVSDGHSTATAGVTIVPVPPLLKRQPPVATDDRQTVRAGDIASVSVLKNDYHPDQERLILNNTLSDVSNAGGGLAFVNGDTVRYQAPAKAGEYSVVYRVDDQFGESATATVTFVVTAPDAATNRPPTATTQTARTFSGSTVRIDIPLDGIDPDGDSVALNGITVNPQQGRISSRGATWFVYEAFEGVAGTDTFSYEVQDTYGAKATGSIVVGIIPRGDLNAQPNAVNDAIEMRPGKTASVQVLLNDSDPNGFGISLEPKLLDVDSVLDASVDGEKVIVTAPETEGGYVLRYQISNGHGGSATAFVQVKVTKNARIVPPTATDYYVLDTEIKGTDPVVVDVQKLINNPSGLDSDLLITSVGPNKGNATVSQQDGTVTVTPKSTRYAVAYQVTDPDDPTLSGTAFIVVPPLVAPPVPTTSTTTNTPKPAAPPYIKIGLPKQIVPMNGTRDWNLKDIVTVPSGKPPIIVNKGSVVATNGNGTLAYVDKDTIRFTPKKDFRGQGSITFEATDGTSATDPLGAKAILQLPITVGDPNFEDVAPSFTKLDIKVQSGETAVATDLRDSTTHPNKKLIPTFTYSGLTAATGGIVATLNGSVLTASAPFGTQPGVKTTVSFVIKYKAFSVPGTVTITTVSSTRPLPNAVDDAAKGQRNVTSTVNVLANDFDPFPDKPLVVLDAALQEPSATMSWTPDGQVTISPTAVGNFHVIYTIEDATKDPARRVKAIYTLTVRDIPDQPAAPAIVSEQDTAVSVSWQPPTTNGEPILEYVLTWNGGSKTFGPNESTATIDGLTNGTNYNFRITASNMLGVSTVSEASAAARPFGAPSAPSSVSISSATNGSGVVSMSWGAASGNGRDVDHYKWTLSDGTTGETTSLSASSTRTVGSSYTVTVVAVGPTGLAGAGKASGSSVTPTPGQVASATATAGAKGDKTVTLKWGNAATTGDIDRYEINVNGEGWKSQGLEHSASYTGKFGSATSFSVRAVDNGSTGAAITSNSVTPEDVPPPTPPGGSITAVSAETYVCQDASAKKVCRQAIFTIHDAPSGTNQAFLQLLNSSGAVTWTSQSTGSVSGNDGRTGGFVADPGAGNSVRVKLVGPNGTFYTDPVGRDTWLNLPQR